MEYMILLVIAKKSKDRRSMKREVKLWGSKKRTTRIVWTRFSRDLILEGQLVKVLKFSFCVLQDYQKEKV